MNYAFIAIISAGSAGAASMPLFLNLTRRAGKQGDRLKTVVINAKIQTHWPALTATTPGQWELAWRWAGWNRAVPPIKKLIIFSASLFFGLLITGKIITGLILIFIFAGGFINLKRLAKKRRQMFEKQLPDALTALVDTLRSGFSLPQAIRFVAEELSPPVQFVFKALGRAEELNLDWGESLRRLNYQLDAPKWAMVAEALIAQSKLGGNIIPLLEESAKTIRDEQTVDEEIKTLTAAGRMSGYLIAGLVPAVLLFFWLASPSYVSAMFTTALGRTLLALALTLEAVGFLWIRKIVKVNY